MINYMDRQVIGILKPTLSHRLHWTEHGYANVVTAFQFAYALGLTEGGMFPAAIKAVGEWFPVEERATATGLFNSASNLGAIVCPLIVPLLAVRFGWPSAFYAAGALGLRVGVVYAMAIFGSVGAGALAQRLLAAGWSLTAARKTALLVCAVAVVPVFAAPPVLNSWVTVVLVGLAAAAHQGASANLYTFASDVMPRRAASSLVGLGGFVLTWTHGSYVPPFLWASTMYLLGLLCLHRLVPKIAPVTEAALRAA